MKPGTSQAHSSAELVLPDLYYNLWSETDLPNYLIRTFADS
jgi:hypothetical protein